MDFGQLVMWENGLWKPRAVGTWTLERWSCGNMGFGNIELWDNRAVGTWTLEIWLLEHRAPCSPLFPSVAKYEELSEDGKPADTTSPGLSLTGSRPSRRLPFRALSGSAITNQAGPLCLIKATRVVLVTPLFCLANANSQR